ncbi:MAG TPA: C25 family cysteine peptidase [Tenuifilaceae bacterium]|nr:C25 family cysteine peptidase [Tenuifilaceae bacterium]
MFQKHILLLLAGIFAYLNIEAQPRAILLKGEKNVTTNNIPYNVVSKQSGKINLKFSIDELKYQTRKVKTGEEFTEIWFSKANTIGKVGEPQLPALKKLVKLPLGASVSIKVKGYNQKEISLSKEGILNPIIPVQPSVSKSEDTLNTPFQIKSGAYKRTIYNQEPIAKIEVLGNLRQYTIARLVISPVDYNPGNASLKIYNDIDVEISVEGGAKSLSDLGGTYSPYFDVLTKTMLNAGGSAYDDHPELTKYPVKMLIISNRIFEDTLKRFVAWKTQKGFDVTVKYTDEIGTTASEIKTYIQQVYNSATVENPAPTFLLLVGDVEQLAASATGTESGKLTDLYYASVDGDIFPEMYYGRLSATTAAELSHIIDKIISYENYDFNDPTRLNNVTLIAGNDATWNPAIAEPTIKYATAYHFNATNGFTTVNEYGVSSDANNPDVQSGYTGCYNSDKITVGFINYTAHCSETSWGDPSLSITQVNSFTNQMQYPLVIANCCLSGNFGYSESIGEAWLRKENGGAVTYIGSSPSSYWKEDMYWAVGAFPMEGDNNGYVPTYEESTTGAYDAPFGSEYVTTGAMMFCGDLAVTQAEINGYPQQINPTYYWEAYNILGDPSLMPYFKEAQSNSVIHPSIVPVGSSSIKVTALDNSLVSITRDTAILGTAFYTANEEQDIPLQVIDSPGKLIITVTRPQTIPYIDTIQAVVVDGPYISLETQTLSDSLGNKNGAADVGETISLNFSLKNMGNNQATDLYMKVNSDYNYLSLSSSDSVYIGTLSNAEGNNTISIENAFTFSVKQNAPDETIQYIPVTFISNEGTWDAKAKVVINAPKIEVNQLTVDDAILGNNDGNASRGESFYANVYIQNTGHADISDLSAIFSIPDSLSNLVILQFDSLDNTLLRVGESYTYRCRLDISPKYPETYEALPLITKVNSSINSQVNGSFINEISLKPSTIIKMEDGSTTGCDILFTDSGGESDAYSSNEDYTYTITSTSANAKLQVVFTEFSIEDGYDMLYIYDGDSNSATQIEGSPFTGLSITDTIYSSGNSITFRFTSDESITYKGWVAQIKCIEPSQVPECVTNPTPADNETNVQDYTLSWNPSTNAQFYKIYIGKTANALGYVGTVNSTSITLNLETDTKYYWKIIPGNFLGYCENACDTWNFTTASIQSINMFNGTASIDSCWFYDTGGAAYEYTNNENYTLTVSPKYSEQKVNIKFETFNVESYTNCSYDYFEIFDGPNTQSTLIGKYCGSTLPDEYTSTSTNGELTFLFHSDGDVVQQGWKAKLNAEGTVTKYNVMATILGKENPVANAVVTVNNLPQITDASGNAYFELPNGTFNYSVTAENYNSSSGTVTVDGQNLSFDVNLEELYTINVSVINGITSSPIEKALVTVNENAYYTKTDGTCEIALPNGDYAITIGKNGYSNYSKNISISDEDESLTASLIPAITVVVTDTNKNAIIGASVTIEDSTKLTDLNGKAIFGFSPDVYLASATKSNYESNYKWINPTVNSKDTIILQNNQELFDLTFNIFFNNLGNVTAASNVNITLYSDNNPLLELITNSNGQAFAQLPSGNYLYDVSKDGYTSINSASFEIDNQGVTVNDTLNELTYTITFVVQSNDSPIEAATISMDGYSDVRTDNHGIAEIDFVLPKSDQLYSIFKTGYETYNGTLNVDSNKTEPVTLTPTDTPTTSKGKVKLYPNPASSLIYISSDSLMEQIEIVNTMGSSILSSKGSYNEIPINIEYLSQGMYLIRITFNNGEVAIVKFIKQ